MTSCIQLLPDIYDVSLDCGGAEEIPSQTVDTGEKLEEPTPPKKTATRLTVGMTVIENGHLPKTL